MINTCAEFEAYLDIRLTDISKRAVHEKKMQAARSKRWAQKNAGLIKEREQTRYKAYRKAYHEEWRHENTAHKKRTRVSHLKRKFGLTPEDWDALFISQGRRCANSGCQMDTPGSKSGWHTDHCHATGKVRGILCQKCNLLLGNANDSIVRLRGAIDYLRKFDSAT